MTVRRGTRRALVPVVVATTLLGGAALAYWSGGGVGDDSGGTGDVVAVSLSPATPVADLYPGGTADVVLTVSNPNTSEVRLGSLALDTTRGTGGFAVDADHAGCGVGALSYATQDNGSAGWAVPGRVDAVNGDHSVTLPEALSMDPGAANGCQGAKFTVYLAAGP